MSVNSAYLEALGVPRWIPRQVADDSAVVAEEPAVEEVVVEESVVEKSVEQQAPTTEAQTVPPESAKETLSTVKALVNNPKAKFVILVDETQPKAELQRLWKQLKFAWKQWQNEDIPASLFQLSAESDYPLEQLEAQQLVIVDTCQQSQQAQKIDAPFASKEHGENLLGDKKAWWQLLQSVHQKSQLL